MKNKKSFFLAAALLFILNIPAFAQETETVEVATESPSFNRVELGFRFMPTISSFNMEGTGDNTIETKATLGFGMGGFLGFNLSNHIGVSGEVLFFSLSQKFVDQDLDRTIKLRYVNFPILLSLSTGKSNTVNLKIEAGPQFGYNLGYSHSSSGDSETDTFQSVFASKKSDFGFAYGAGLGIKINEKETLRLDMGYRGVYGFINIVDGEQTDNGTTQYFLKRAKVRTHSAYLGIAWIF